MKDGKNMQGLCSNPIYSWDMASCVTGLDILVQLILNVPNDRLQLSSWKTNLENNKSHF